MDKESWKFSVKMNDETWGYLLVEILCLVSSMFFLSISSSLSICSAEVFPEPAKKYGTQVCYMYVKEIAGLENFFNMFALGYSYLI